MRRARAGVLSCSLWLAVAATAAAQSAPPPVDAPVFVEPLSQDQDRELDGWLSEMEKWRRYDAKHHNRPARDAFGRIVARRTPPAPPQWLTPYCVSAARAGIADLEARTARACRLAKDPWEAADPVVVAMQAARDAAEKTDKYSSFLRRLHVDGLGVTTSSGPRVYGIIGSHITLVDVGRVQVFGPPGVLLLSVPDVGGGRRLTLGYTWGISVRLTDVRLLAPSSNVTLFLTVSKLWVNGSGNARPDTGGLQIVSLSLAPRKTR